MSQQKKPEKVIVDLRHIHKRFGGTIALNDVSFQIAPGEIVGLIGENGAGKSTLMNVMSGVLQPDAGTMAVDGRQVSHLSPGAALDLGIQIVHQELSLLPEMTVAENIFLGKEFRSAAGVIQKAACRKRSKELLEEFQIDISVDQKVSELSAAQKQLVEIAKSMVGKRKVLILDEPTSSLTDREMACLSRILPKLKEQGTGIVFISHKLNEVKDLCDSIAVLRDGSMVRRELIENVTTDDMVNLMVGREIEDAYAPSAYKGDAEVVLDVRGLCSAAYGEASVQDVHLQVRRGEIVGVFGLIGSGRTEIIKALHGLRPIQSGTVKLSGRTMTRFSPAAMIRGGVGWVTEDRRHQGVCLEMSIKNNIGMPIYRQVSRFGVINEKRLDQMVNDYIRRLSIKTPGSDMWAMTLSGGNQQKVVLAKWLASNPQMLILDEPTRGIDVGSKSEIHRFIRSLRDDGMAVLVISSELPELFALSDRIVVMREGRISGELDRSNPARITEENILRMATIGDEHHEN